MDCEMPWACYRCDAMECTCDCHQPTVSSTSTTSTTAPKGLDDA